MFNRYEAVRNFFHAVRQVDRTHPAGLNLRTLVVVLTCLTIGGFSGAYTGTAAIAQTRTKAKAKKQPKLRPKATIPGCVAVTTLISQGLTLNRGGQLLVVWGNSCSSSNPNPNYACTFVIANEIYITKGGQWVYQKNYSQCTTATVQCGQGDAIMIGNNNLQTWPFGDYCCVSTVYAGGTCANPGPMIGYSEYYWTE